MYEAKLTVKFDSKYTRNSYSSYETDSLPEEHFTFEVPAEDLNSTQVFGLFRKVMLTMGYDENVIASGMMSTVFNPDGDEKLMRKLCDEYDLIMAEDFGQQLQEEVKKQVEIEKELMRVKKGPMGTVMGDLSDDNMPPWGHSDMEALANTSNDVWEITDPHGTIVTNGDTSNHPSWEDRYWSLYRRFQKFARFTDEELNWMVENHKSIHAAPGSYRKLYQENLDLKAKLSRLENPDAPQYTDEEIDAMSYEEHVSSEALAAMCSEESGMN